MDLSPFDFSPPPSDVDEPLDDDELPISTGDEAEDEDDDEHFLCLDGPTSERALYSFEHQPRDVARRTTEMRDAVARALGSRLRAAHAVAPRPPASEDDDEAAAVRARAERLYRLNVRNSAAERDSASAAMAVEPAASALLTLMMHLGDTANVTPPPDDDTDSDGASTDARRALQHALERLAVEHDERARNALLASKGERATAKPPGGRAPLLLPPYAAEGRVWNTLPPQLAHAAERLQRSSLTPSLPPPSHAPAAPNPLPPQIFARARVFVARSGLGADAPMSRPLMQQLSGGGDDESQRWRLLAGVATNVPARAVVFVPVALERQLPKPPFGEIVRVNVDAPVEDMCWLDGGAAPRSELALVATSTSLALLHAPATRSAVPAAVVIRTRATWPTSEGLRLRCCAAPRNARAAGGVALLAVGGGDARGALLAIGDASPHALERDPLSWRREPSGGAGDAITALAWAPGGGGGEDRARVLASLSAAGAVRLHDARDARRSIACAPTRGGAGWRALEFVDENLVAAAGSSGAGVVELYDVRRARDEVLVFGRDDAHTLALLRDAALDDVTDIVRCSSGLARGAMGATTLALLGARGGVSVWDVRSHAAGVITQFRGTSPLDTGAGGVGIARGSAVPLRDSSGGGVRIAAMDPAGVASLFDISGAVGAPSTKPELSRAESAGRTRALLRSLPLLAEDLDDRLEREPVGDLLVRAEHLAELGARERPADDADDEDSD